MALRYFGNREYALDDRFNLYVAGSVLVPCERITSKRLTIGIVGNGTLNPKNFLVLPKDRGVITVTIPDDYTDLVLRHQGKSAFVHVERCVRRHQIADAMAVKTGISVDRRDKLYLATVGDVDDSGWQVWWAPLQMMHLPLHCRLIANTTISSGNDPTMDDAENLNKVFRKCEAE